MSTLELQSELTSAEPAVGGIPDWVASIPENRRKHLRIWLWIGAIITASTLFIGGVTRLTESGLSMVDWEPIIGVIPPISDADWNAAFARYQEFPEYIQARPDMTMGEFQFIYFWEYLHRMMGRFLGVVFAVPFIVFWIRGYFNPPLIRRLLLLFVLGGAQGLMGWYMVQSGLVDNPDVSHVRLASHLVLAVTIFACCIWFANDLLARPVKTIAMRSRNFLKNTIIWIGVLLGIQIFWGGLVAGLKAGLSFNTFPLMGGQLVPPGAWGMNPTIINLVENPATVQWLHRVLATLLLGAAIALWYRIRRDDTLARFRTWSAWLAGIIVLQYLLGILTVLTHVRIDAAVTHQMVALITVGILLTFLHVLLHHVPEEQEAAGQ